MPDSPLYTDSVYVLDRWIPLGDVKVLDAEQDYTGHFFIVSFRYRGRVYKSRLERKKIK